MLKSCAKLSVRVRRKNTIINFNVNDLELQNCDVCNTPSTMRFIEVRQTECWNCDQPMRIMKVIGGNGGAWGNDFSDEECEFAIAQRVKLDTRYTYMTGITYSANVCSHCDSVFGDWFIYFEPDYYDNPIVTQRLMLERNCVCYGN